ncbi:MAG: putative toxin-antitoxin system toxin component, PIN family [Bacteroidota bacterium]
MRIVLDTNIWVSAFRSKHGASAKLISLIGGNHFSIVTSVPLVLEYEEVFFRQRGQMNLDKAKIDHLLDLICALSDHQRIYYLWRPTEPDGDDAHVLELAVAAKCDYIITYNKRDFTQAASFGIEVVTAAEFLQKLG